MEPQALLFTHQVALEIIIKWVALMLCIQGVQAHDHSSVEGTAVPPDFSAPDDDGVGRNM
jgi:hypothetical protein